MKFTKLAVSFLAGAVIFCGCAKDNSAAIKVNDKIITKKEFNEDFSRLKNAQFKNAPKEFQKDDSYPVLVLKNRFVNDIIVRNLLEQEFEKRKITADQKEIDAKKAIVIAQIGSEEKFNTILKENRISKERLNSDMASEVKMEKLVNSLGIGKVSDKDVEKYYKENKQSFDLPERVHVMHILIDTNPESVKRKIVDADKEAKLSSTNIDEKVAQQVKENEALVQKVLKEAKANPKNFSALAKQYSQDTASAQKGGDLGFAPRGQFVPEFEKVAFSQKVGTISDPVKTQYGTHIIYVVDKSAKGVQPLAKVKEDLKTYLGQQKKMEGVQKYVEGLKNSAKIEYIDTELSPEVLGKKIEEALPKQIELEKKLSAPKKSLADKFKKTDKDKETEVEPK